MNESLEIIQNYQKETDELQKSLGDNAQKNNNLLKENKQKLGELKKELDNYLVDYENKLKNISKDVSNEIKDVSNENITLIKNELYTAVEEITESLTKTLKEVYGDLNEGRLALIDTMEKSVDFNSTEEELAKKLEVQIREQNIKLKKVVTEIKKNINYYKEAHTSSQNEIEVLKQNFELKYNYSAKRIIVTTILSFFMVLMAGATIISSVIIFNAYNEIEYFTQRFLYLIMSIFLLITAIFLIGLLILSVLRPPTFLRVKKIKKQDL